MWINLAAVVITLLVIISAYRREDITQRRFRILAQNYDSLLAEKMLKDMEREDPERAKELGEKIRARLPKAPEGKSKILMDPGNTNSQETPLAVLLQLDRISKTKGGQE